MSIVFKITNLALMLGAFVIITLSSAAYAEGSNATMPEGWEEWPIISSGAIPSNDKPISEDLPSIVQETFKMYNWVNEGHGTAYNVRVNPAQDAGYKNGGEYEDISTAVLELTDIGVILVTEHLMDEPVYGAYTIDGKDMGAAHPSLAPEACLNCHSGYAEICVKGVCTSKK